MNTLEKILEEMPGSLQSYMKNKKGEQEDERYNINR